MKIPAAIGPRYQGLPLAGPAKAFDRLLDCWLAHSLDLGMIGSGLGQLFPVNLHPQHQAGTINAEYLRLVGMGEPGQFAQDDLRYLMSNVTVVVKAMGHYQLSTMLIGTRRNELPLDHAFSGFLEGILDGYERFCAVTDRREDFEQARRADAVRPGRRADPWCRSDGDSRALTMNHLSVNPNCLRKRTLKGFSFDPTAPSVTRYGGSDDHQRSYSSLSLFTTSGCLSATSVFSPGSAVTSKSCHPAVALPTETKCQRVERTLQPWYL